jgi:tyrosine-protein phosphatase SIW14
MVNRLPFSSLCKTFLVMYVVAAACASHAQTVADTSAQPAMVRASFGAPAEKLKLAGVSNAGKVSEMLLRGAQPSAQGLAALKKLGVTTIVDLRGNSGSVAWERAQAESLGIRFVNIPVGSWSPPSDAQVAQFLKLVQENPMQKIFVHCHYGEDRTSVMVATYRIAAQNWTPEQAAAEMNSFGFHYHLYRAMKSYVREFPAKFAADPVFSSLHTSPAPR